MTPPTFTLTSWPSSTPVTVPLKLTPGAICALTIAGNSKAVINGPWVSKITAVLNSSAKLPAWSATLNRAVKSLASAMPVKSNVPENSPLTNCAKCATVPRFILTVCPSCAPVTVPWKTILSAMAAFTVSAMVTESMTGALVSKISELVNSLAGLPARSSKLALICRSSVSSKAVKSITPENAPLTTLAV